jgi:N-methylhydantoinase A
VGPQSAGADPGPAAYGRGGVEPTVTDANVVLGYLPAQQKLGGDMRLDRVLAVNAVQKIATSLNLSLEDAARGIYDIVNENMVGALRLVSVEQGYDPRDYALIAFGGAGPLHANALARLLGSWPAIIPPGPGVLCALGDATTAVRDERSRTFVKKFSDTSAEELGAILEELADAAIGSLEQEGVRRSEITTTYQVDLRYRGQGLRLTIPLALKDLKARGLKAISSVFDAEHKRLFTFALELEHELVTLRAAVQGRGIKVKRAAIPRGTADPRSAVVGRQRSYMDGKRVTALIYDRAKFKAGNVIRGPAIIMEMDSTTVVLPKHHGRVDALGNVLIYPDGFKAPQAKPGAGVKANASVKKTVKRAVKRKTSKSPS